MPVDARTHQPFGLLHGGASAWRRWARWLMTEEGQCVVGTELNATHHRPVSSGKCAAGTDRCMWPPESELGNWCMTKGGAAAPVVWEPRCLAKTLLFPGLRCALSRATDL